MPASDKVRITLPGWLQSYRGLRLKQQKCLDRIRQLSAALCRSRNKVAIVRNLVQYRRWMDYLVSLQHEAPKMRFSDEREWQFGGTRAYYDPPKPTRTGGRKPHQLTVRLPLLRQHAVLQRTAKTRSGEQSDLRLPTSVFDNATRIHGCPADSTGDHTGKSILCDLRKSLERQESIPSKKSPRLELRKNCLPRIFTTVEPI